MYHRPLLGLRQHVCWRPHRISPLIPFISVHTVRFWPSCSESAEDRMAPPVRNDLIIRVGARVASAAGPERAQQPCLGQRAGSSRRSAERGVALMLIAGAQICLCRLCSTVKVFLAGCGC